MFSLTSLAMAIEDKPKPIELNPESIECRETGLFQAGKNLEIKNYSPTQCRQTVFQARKEGEVILLHSASGLLEPKGGFPEVDGRRVLELAANEIDCRLLPTSVFRRTFELQLRNRGTPLWRDTTNTAAGSREACLRAQESALVNRAPLFLDLKSGNLWVKKPERAESPTPRSRSAQSAGATAQPPAADEPSYDQQESPSPEEGRLLDNLQNGYELIPQH
jgi:hypothetical protein